MTKEEAFLEWASHTDRRKDLNSADFIPPIWMSRMIFLAGWEARKKVDAEIARSHAHAGRGFIIQNEIADAIEKED